MNDIILQETYSLISSHKKDCQGCGKIDGLCTIRRLLDKKLTATSSGNCSQASLDESNITSTKEEWTLSQLCPLRGHLRINPHIQQCQTAQSSPVVVVNYQGKDYLLDGNNRVNFWIGAGDMDKKIRVNYHRIG